MQNRLAKSIAVAVIATHLAACGTILYPERKGQVSGKIDAGVAALNGIGLLFFLVPGVIAFAVDFNNGTIYLPNSTSVDGEDDGLRVVQAHPNMTPNELQEIIEKEVGQPVDLSKAQVESGTAADQASIQHELTTRTAP
ncbi:MAG TPA: hypothetical protein VFM61_06305 [Pseudidiomarina sp.]|nr:hypothetical protein [Pseudidiomarina sp.]